MIFYKNRKWNMCSEKVRYVQHGEEITQYVGAESKDWWIDFEQKHSHTEIIEFVDVVVTNEQLARLEEVNQFNIGDGFSAALGDYVEDGVFPEGFNHVLKPIQLQKESGNLSNYILDVDMRLTMQALGL